MELRNILRGYSEVSIKNDQNISGCYFKSSSNCVPFTLARLSERTNCTMWIGLPNPKNFLPSGILTVAFDEYDLQIRTEIGQSLNRRLNVASLVTTGNYYRGG
jgi:hypothetical protein